METIRPTAFSILLTTLLLLGGLFLFVREAEAHAVIDLNVAAAAIDESSSASTTVMVEHKARGTLFALVPVTFTATARAYPNGDVELDYPWYANLSVTNHDKLRAELKVAVDAALHAERVGTVMAEGNSVPKTSFTPKEVRTISIAMDKVLGDNYGD